MLHKLTWKQYKRRTGLWLRVDFQSDQLWQSSIDYELTQIAEWSDSNKCGSRQAYDMWKFAGKKKLTAFLLKWT